LAMHHAGVDVLALAPKHHSLHKIAKIETRVLGRTQRKALRTIRETVERLSPSRVIPGDDRAVAYLHSLHTQEKGRSSRLATLIERSIGPPASFVYEASRKNLIQLGGKEELLMPKARVVGSIKDFQEILPKETFPLVLKLDGTSGGEGVRIA